MTEDNQLANSMRREFGDLRDRLVLPDAEFIADYLAMMATYAPRSGGSVPACTKCKQEIRKPGELRRYHGARLHPECFKTVRQLDKPNPRTTPELYHKRVADLMC